MTDLTQLAPAAASPPAVAGAGASSTYHAQVNLALLALDNAVGTAIAAATGLEATPLNLLPQTVSQICMALTAIEAAAADVSATVSVALDSALPNINTEFLELQLTLMLEIAEQVGDTGTTEHLLACFMHHLRIMGTDEDVLQTRRTIFGSVNSSPVSGKFQFRQNPMLREEGDDRTDDSETEVEVRKGDESGDMSMDGVLGAPSYVERERLGRVISHARSSDSSEDGRRRDSIAGRASFSSASGPSSPGSTSTPHKSVPTLLQTPRSSPTVAGSSSLSLSTLIFGKAGSLLSAKPNEMSEGSAGSGDELEEGELDAEGEVVIGTPADETSSAGRASFAYGPKIFRFYYIVEYSELPSGSWVE
ncbi:hypothetical protein B0H13DRAFT_2320110 [Mycena leptocephala]|nr:hypothetical protein B0H13DRAFT_2320110 [Mycena leptocephala]